MTDIISGDAMFRSLQMQNRRIRFGQGRLEGKFTDACYICFASFFSSLNRKSGFTVEASRISIVKRVDPHVSLSTLAHYIRVPEIC